MRHRVGLATLATLFALPGCVAVPGPYGQPGYYQAYGQRPGVWRPPVHGGPVMAPGAELYPTEMPMAETPAAEMPFARLPASDMPASDIAVSDMPAYAPALATDAREEPRYAPMPTGTPAMRDNGDTEEEQ